MIINERFINATTKDMKDKFRDQVWDLLQDSYASLGGIKGSGFENPENMDSIPFWKLVVRDGDVCAVVMYKNSSGRKRIVMGNDGSEYGKKALINIALADLKRSYVEVSKASLGMIMKSATTDQITNAAKSPKVVEKILKKEIIPVVDLPDDAIPPDGHISINRWPLLKNYGYLREIGGGYVFKILLGNPGNPLDI